MDANHINNWATDKTESLTYPKLNKRYMKVTDTSMMEAGVSNRKKIRFKS